MVQIQLLQRIKNGYFAHGDFTRISLRIQPDLPDWRGSMGLPLSWEQKDHWLDSQSGHRPGFQARSLVGGIHKATDGCFSSSLSPSLSLCLKINK